MHANLFNQNASEKDVFLHNLRSNNGRYKRYIKAPLRYGGGKFFSCRVNSGIYT